MSFSERKKKKLPPKCLPFKWDYIQLSLNELASTNQFSCPSPCSLNTISSIKTYHETKLISRFKNDPEIFKKVQKDSLKRLPVKLYNLYLKTFLTDWIFKVYKVEFVRFFISLALSRLSEWFAKNPENFEERLKSPFEKIHQISLF